MENEWKKSCPKCGREQVYCSKKVLEISIGKNSICVKCTVDRSRIHNGNFERICKCGKILKYTCRQSLNLAKKHNAKCRNCAMKESSKLMDRSFMKSDEYREKMSKSIKNSDKHKNMFTEEFREKLRIAKLNQIKKLGTKYTYNPKACDFIEEFGNKNGYNFQHAMNGGEIVVSGYSLDGYDKEKNIVFEYDEPKHNRIGTKKRDRIREERIIEKIKPNMFIRYDEKSKTTKDVISGKELM